MHHRRQFLKACAIAPLAAALPGAVPEYEKPLLDLHKFSRTPIKVNSIELLQNGKNYFVRATSTDGVTGMVRTKQVDDYIPILLRRVAPFFVGKDIRDLETLIDDVYIENYKMAGQAFWAPVAYVEQALFDLYGKTIDKPVGVLLGGVLRKEIPVYLSGSIRTTKAEEEVEIYHAAMQKSGTKGCKFKIGGRMSRNQDPYPGRTETLVKLARKKMGDNAILYADANGSYDSAKAIEIGRMLEELKYDFFEEPCPWEEKSETKKVADALKIPIAFGEQDSSLWMFQYMIQTRTIDIVQPDLNYNGGFIRAARVANMAKSVGMKIVNHNTQTGASAVNILQFASAIVNIGPYMEFPYRGKDENESWFTPKFEIKNGLIPVPTGPGMGISFDPDYLKAAKVVTV